MKESREHETHEKGMHEIHELSEALIKGAEDQTTDAFKKKSASKRNIIPVP